jgi:DNA polymerase-3 subunit beta
MLRVTLDRAQLVGALDALLPCVNLPPGEGLVEITATADRVELEVRSSELHGVVILPPPAHLPAPGAIVQSLEQLRAIVRSVRSDVVELSEQQGRHIIRAGTHTARLAIPSDEMISFSRAPEYPTAYQIDASHLRRAIEATLPSVGEANRYAINGIYLEPGEIRMRLVATDGHALAWAELSRKLSGPAMSALIPSSLAYALLRSLPDEGVVVVEVSPQRLRVSTDAGSVSGRLLDGAFPDYRQVVPASEAGYFKASAPGLIGILRRHARVARGGKSRCPTALAFLRGLEAMQIQTTAVGHDLTVEDEIQPEIFGEPPRKTGFNAELLSRALAAVGGDVHVSMTTALAPVVVSSAENAAPVSVTALVMPMRID